MASAIALRPACVEELVEIVLEARRDRRTLAPAGGRSKDDIGAHRADAVPIDMTGFAGVTDYDPTELVLTVGTGKPLAESDTLVDAERKMPAFEPLPPGPTSGRPELKSAG